MDIDYSRCQNSLTINVTTFTKNLTYVNHLKKLLWKLSKFGCTKIFYRFWRLFTIKQEKKGSTILLKNLIESFSSINVGCRKIPYTT